MHAPEAKMTPVMRPFLPGSSQFSSGADTPRDFFERCLTDLERWDLKSAPLSASISPLHAPQRRGWSALLTDSLDLCRDCMRKFMRGDQLIGGTPK